MFTKKLLYNCIAIHVNTPPYLSRKIFPQLLAPFRFFPNFWMLFLRIQPHVPSRRVTLVPSVWILRFAPWNRKPRPSNCSISAKRYWRFEGVFHEIFVGISTKNVPQNVHTNFLEDFDLDLGVISVFLLSYRMVLWAELLKSEVLFSGESCDIGRDQFHKMGLSACPLRGTFGSRGFARRTIFNVKCVGDCPKLKPLSTYLTCSSRFIHFPGSEEASWTFIANTPEVCQLAIACPGKCYILFQTERIIFQPSLLREKLVGKCCCCDVAWGFGILQARNDSALSPAVAGQD